MLGFHSSRRYLAACLALALALPAVLESQQAGRTNPPAPGRTETLSYNIEWRLITAGTAVVRQSGNRLNVRLQSAGLVSKLYKVDDTYDVDYEPGLCATSLHLAAEEGRRKRDTRVTFDRAGKRAQYIERDLVKNEVFKQGQIEVPGCVHDIAGALHAVRGMQIEAGHSAELPVSDGKKFAKVRVEAQEREEIKVKGKPVKTVRYEAFIFNNIIYGRKGRLMLWLTDDERKVPVQIQARMSFPIGNLTLVLDKEDWQ